MCTCELPDTYPFVVQEAYIKEFIVKWKQPAMELFDSVYEILKVDVAQLVNVTRKVPIVEGTAYAV